MRSSCPSCSFCSFCSSAVSTYSLASLFALSANCVLDFPKSITSITKTAAIPMIEAKSPSNRFTGTLPINIMINTTRNINAAVEKFSGSTSPMSARLVPMIYLKAFGDTPSGVCN